MVCPEDPEGEEEEKTGCHPQLICLVPEEWARELSL
jgi:hypothetical protein